MMKKRLIGEETFEMKLLWHKRVISPAELL
jgi:hypothetical protein